MRQQIEMTLEGYDEKDAREAIPALLAAFSESPFMSPTASFDKAGLHLHVQYDDAEGLSQDAIELILQLRIISVLGGEEDDAEQE